MSRRNVESPASSIRLTDEQDAAWVAAYEHYGNNEPGAGKPEDAADRELIARWPELARYRHWQDPA